MSLGILNHLGVPRPNLPFPPGEGGGEGVLESVVRAPPADSIRNSCVRFPLYLRCPAHETLLSALPPAPPRNRLRVVIAPRHVRRPPRARADAVGALVVR